MKLSCLPVSYFNAIRTGEMTIRQWAQQAKGFGLDAIDLSIILVDHLDLDSLVRIRKEIESFGLELAVMNTYPDLTHPDPAIRKQQFDHAQASIFKASQLGAKMVRITAGQAHPETTTRIGILWAVESLKNLVQIGDRNKVKVIFENHSKPGVWNYPDFAMPKNIFLEICQKLAETHIGILFDTANPLVCGEDPHLILDKVIDRVVCVHAADTKMAGVLAPVIIGTGCVPFKELFAKLRNFNYDGWISIEEASNMGETSIATAVKYVRKTWHDCRRKD